MGGDGARPRRVLYRRGYRRVRRRLQGDRGTHGTLRRPPRGGYADLRSGHRGCVHRRGPDGIAAGRRDAVRRFHLLRLRPDRQFRRQVPLPLERRRAHRDPRALRRRHPRRPLPFAESRDVVRAHGRGRRGCPFHSQNPEMWFVRTPGLKVVCPATAYDAKGLIKSAIRDNDPVLFFEHKGLYRRIKEDLPSEEYTVPIGKAKVVRQGRDLSIITYGAMVWTALEAAETLAAEGCSVEVVDLRTLLPLDRETICASVRKTSKALLLHEDTRTGGMAGELAATITENVFEYLDGPIVRVTAPDTPVPYSPPLEEAFLPNAEKVVEKARWLHRY